MKRHKGRIHPSRAAARKPNDVGSKQPGEAKETHETTFLDTHLLELDLDTYVDDFNRRVIGAYQQGTGSITLPADVGINYGVSGPTLRGSGVNWDLRRDDPYGIYDKFEWEVQVGKGERGTLGDCWDRYIVRVREMEESVRIIEQALAVLPEGNVQAAIPKRIRPDSAEIYVRTETARGELGFYVVSDGTASPYRLKARAPAFVNLSVLPEISRGCMLADLVAIVGSVDIVLGEVDR